MSDSESIKKMLRSVLQSSKTGISITSLQSEYRSLCGETIPLKKLGFSTLEDYLRSIPSVVRLENCMGEIKCCATVCKETAHIAELVAKQKSSKKSGRSQVVNCRMRFKPSNPYRLNVNPRSSLRQPSAGGDLNWSANRFLSVGGYRGFSASGDYRQLDQRLSSITPMEHRQPGPQTHRKEQSLVNAQKLRENPPKQSSKDNKSQTSVFDVQLVQTRLTRLLEKYCSGLWMSKLSETYNKMFCQTLHPQVLEDLKEWTHICMVEQPSSHNKFDNLIYPCLPSKPSVVTKSSPGQTPSNSPTNSTITTPISSPVSTPRRIPSLLPTSLVPKARVYTKSPLANPTLIFHQKPVAVSSGKPLSSVTLPIPAHNPAVAPLLPQCVNLDVSASGGCKPNQNLTTALMTSHNRLLVPTYTCSTSGSASADVSSNFDSGPSSKPSTLSTEVCERIKELLSKYSQGIWAHALPKLFMDTYKTPFPKHVLDNVSLYPHIWSVEYPISDNKTKAILYNASKTDMEATDCEGSHRGKSDLLPSGLQVVGTVVPPSLILPPEQFPSVLVIDAKSSNNVTVRYVGENYSNAQEAMEECMHSFYKQSVSCHPVPNPVVGQLVAIRGEDGDELARAQVMEIMPHNRVKVYYVDYGFSVETSGTSLLELHQDFLYLPFQATTVRLAGLEAFSSHPLVVSCLDRLAVDKILLMERLEACQQEMPLAVLYDTSQDDDLNINSACLKALQDETMSNPLTLNVTYQDVCVTNVCGDGIIYCQLPSKGTVRLGKLLEKTEASFIAQVSSEPLVSRPFIGKICLARYKGKWSRVEITNMHGNRVMEIIFIDLGLSATVEVTDLREIPPPLFKEFAIIPPQAIKCRLADLLIPEDDWSPEAIQWVKDNVLGSENCKMKIVKLEEHKGSRLAYMYLFTDADSQELDKSINHQLTNSGMWHRFARNSNSVDTGLSALAIKIDSSIPNTFFKASVQPHQGHSMPPPLELPQPGQNMDVFVPVACHPGYFVLQPWQDLHKLVVLMGEMILYYNQTWKMNTAIEIQKGEVCAAKMEDNWYRVLVKGILTNGMVSVYDLDHGKHELIRSTLIRPLTEEFRQLPFQAITAQLAGVTQHHWTEESCMLFRNHVEKRALVAHVESVQELSEIRGEPWNRRLAVYLVDTTLEDRDLWIHNMLVDLSSEHSSAA